MILILPLLAHPTHTQTYDIIWSFDDNAVKRAQHLWNVHNNSEICTSDMCEKWQERNGTAHVTCNPSMKLHVIHNPQSKNSKIRGTVVGNYKTINNSSAYLSSTFQVYKTTKTYKNNIHSMTTLSYIKQTAGKCHVMLSTWAHPPWPCAGWAGWCCPCHHGHRA